MNAFVSVSWKFVINVLQAIEVPECLVQWVEVCITEGLRTPLMLMVVWKATLRVLKGCNKVMHSFGWSPKLSSSLLEGGSH